MGGPYLSSDEGLENVSIRLMSRDLGWSESASCEWSCTSGKLPTVRSGERRALLARVICHLTGLPCWMLSILDNEAGV